ncbi:thioredoxin-like protein 1 [Procambarus clarkii]|uniref:thioredoxin-like protein 1 n=1 Tax=Procambarus clarkii TaxID=6728 RepID=UPI001E677630|nr:thioredoxin-like protein 1 [Procambarus clarkii]
MATNFKVLTEDAQFQPELSQAGGRLVVADFTSARCGPCQRIAPLFEEMAARFPNAVFLKIDVKECTAAASSQGVSATPTFIFYRNKTKLDSLQGADPETLEARIRQHYGDGEGEEVEDSGVPGHIDLIPMINKAGCECLNESDDHPFTQALTSAGGYLESDTDEQLILYLSFNQAVKLHSIKFKGPAENGPKVVRLFINQPHTIDFDSAESANAVQELTLSTKDLDGELIPLKYVKLQNVMNLTLFVKNNQTDADTTQISYIQIIGSPVQTTKMSDFKRVTGKKGESH